MDQVAMRGTRFGDKMSFQIPWPHRCRYMVIFLEEQLAEKTRLLRLNQATLGSLRHAHDDRVRTLEARVGTLEEDVRVRDSLLSQAGIRVRRTGEPAPEGQDAHAEAGSGPRGRRGEVRGEGRGGGDVGKAGAGPESERRWESKLEKARSIYAKGAVLRGGGKQGKRKGGEGGGKPKGVDGAGEEREEERTVVGGAQEGEGYGRDEAGGESGGDGGSGADGRGEEAGEERADRGGREEGQGGGDGEEGKVAAGENGESKE